MELNPYLNFNGQCAEAFRFYEQCFGGKILMMQTHGETPAKDHVPPDWHDKVMHARMTVGEQVLMGSDAPPDRYSPPTGISVAINVASPAEGERIFKQLAEGGTVTMPFEKTFWSSGFGMLVDRFGIPWMVNSAEAPEPA
jgi:PhnB protein